MFPNELNALLQADSNARPILYRAAYADYFVKVSEFDLFDFIFKTDEVRIAFLRV